MAYQPVTSENHAMRFPVGEGVTFDIAAFDDFIHSQGVEMVHWRAMKCPVGMIDPDDIRRPHDDHQGCSNGFVYTLAGIVTCAFSGNSVDPRLIDIGRLDGSTAQVTFPRYYDDSPDQNNLTPVQPAKYDRVYLKESRITVSNWEVFAAHKTGIDRLQFPISKVVDLMDSRGKRYSDSDFKIVDGQLRWEPNKGPGVDPKTNHGTVCTIRYTYKPFWYVKRLIHEVRVAQMEDDATGDRRIERLPQSMELQREYFFEKEDKDRQAPEVTRRQVPGPASGGFGPR